MNNSKQKPKTTRQFVKICLEDLEAIVHHKWAVVNFWHLCWKADPYGSRWMVCPKPDNMSDRSFREAKKVLQDEGFFVFRRVCDYEDSRKTSHWEVKNLHGARVKSFWLHQLDTSGVTDEDPEVANHYEKGEAQLQARKNETLGNKKSGKSSPEDVLSEQIDGIEMQPISEKSLENQCLQLSSVSSQELLMEEFLREEGEQVVPALRAALPVSSIEKEADVELVSESNITSVFEAISLLPVANKPEPVIEESREVSGKPKLLAKVLPEKIDLLSSNGEILLVDIPETVTEPVSDWNYSTPEERQRTETEFELQKNTVTYQQTKAAASVNLKQKLLLTALNKTKNPLKRQQLHNQLREIGWQPSPVNSDDSTNSLEVHYG